MNYALDLKSLFEEITEEYSNTILHWAVKKSGDRNDAADLAQEVMLQVFLSVSRIYNSGREIEKVENFVWKIAHNVWCYRLRTKKQSTLHTSFSDMDGEIRDDDDFVARMGDEAEMRVLIEKMRRNVVFLNKMQRETMILHYIEGYSIRDIAKKLDCAESAVKWYLFDTRKKLKKEFTETMETTNFVYRPGKLWLARSGQSAVHNDTDIVNTSLTMQNVILACYPDPKNLDEIAKTLAIPKAYIENDLAWLVEKEFLAESKSSKYVTILPIQNLLYSQSIAKVYLDHKEKFSDVIIDSLLDSEDEIRKIGFVGSDRPMSKLLWTLIYMYGQMQERSIVPKNIVSGFSYPLRPDGGYYFPLIFDESENQRKLDNFDFTAEGFGYNGGMTYKPFYWFGLYNFANDTAPEKLFDSDSEKSGVLRDMISRCLKENFDPSSLSSNEKDILASLIKDGFFAANENKFTPNFCVFTPDQYSALNDNILAKIEEKVAPELLSIAAGLRELCKKSFPDQAYKDFITNLALYDTIYYTEFFAMADNKSYKPANTKDGEFLTLYVRT